MKYLSLFSGIGGFELGIENSNKELECVGYAEIDKYADSIYRRHFPEHNKLGDVTRIKTEELEDFDLLVGGFPCQAFSIAGHQRGFDDTRGTLFFEIARILKDKKPKYFLLENVRNLLSHDKGGTFQTILKVLSEMGYDVQWQIYNSKDFGVPQNRERIYLKGHFRERCGGEVLSFTNTSGETNEKVDYYRDCKRSYTIHRKGEDGISATTTGTGQNSGYNQLIKLNDKAQAQTIYDINGVSCSLSANGGGQGGKTGLYAVDEPKIEKIGNFSPNNHNGKNIYSTDEISPTLCSGSLYKNGLNILDDGHFTTIDNEKGITTTTNGDCFCVTTAQKVEPLKKKQFNFVKETNNYIKIKNATKQGYLKAEEEEDGINIVRPSSNNRRGRVQKKSTGTLSTGTGSGWGIYNDYRVRRLTPLECERLQAFPDNWTQYGANDEKISDTQRYKCCGNAVTTTVVTAIMNDWELKQ